MPTGQKSQLIGRKFFKLTVISESKKRAWNKVHWNCVCDCGKKTIVSTGSLTSGNTKSCGCLNMEAIVLRNTTHGMAGTPEHNIWTAMIQRCTNPNNNDWKDYGGRGITVCSEWAESFEAFLESVGKRPEKNLTLERRDNARGYCPGNVCWATRKHQANNRRARDLSVMKRDSRTGRYA